MKKATTVRSLPALLIYLALEGAAPSVWAAACVTATPTCTEFVSVTQSPSRLLVYRSHSLTSRNEQITTALIVVHGTGRNGNDYFRSGVAAGFLAQALDRTVVIAPRFASGSGVSGADGTECKDALAKGEASWVCESRSPHSWRSGGAETGTGKATSYDFMDEILRQLASRQSFPNLKAIVLAGHSAGGQFVTRYQMANRVHDSLGLPISYIVSNPSSYTYLDSLRPTVSSFPSSVASAAPGYQSPIPAKPPAPFVPFAEAASCTTYDNWPYGLKDRVGYAANIPDEQLRKQAAARPATYLLGDNDILPLGGFDSSCPARAQGPTRFARGLAFHKNLNERFGARHNVVIVPLCGHNNRCIYTSDVALPLLFPDAATASR